MAPAKRGPVLEALFLGRGLSVAALTEAVDVDREELEAFCERHHVRKLAFFESVLEEGYGSESDVDVLVWFEEGHTPGFFGFVRMERELGEVLDADELDLHTPGSLNRRFREDVLASAEVQYAQA